MLKFLPVQLKVLVKTYKNLQPLASYNVIITFCHWQRVFGFFDSIVVGTVKAYQKIFGDILSTVFCFFINRKEMVL